MSALSLHLIIYAASALVIPTVLLAVLRIVGGRLSGRVCAAVILMCAVRILIPTGFIEGIFTLGGSDSGDIVIIEGEADISGGEVISLPSDGEAMQDAIITSPLSVAKTEVDIATVIGTIWLCSSVTVFLLSLAAELVLGLRERREELPASGSVNELYASISRELGILSPPILAVVSGASVPHLAGMFKKRIVVGEAFISDDGLCDVLRHELIHYKRHHIEAKLFMLLVFSVFWWNPAVTLLVRKFDEALELVADEGVLFGADDARRIAYAETVFRIMKTAKTRHAPLSTELVAHNSKRRKRRFAAMLNGERKLPALPIVLTCAVLISTTLILVGCKSADNPDGAPTVFYIDSEEISPDRIKDLSELPDGAAYEGYRQVGWSVGSPDGDELRLRAVLTPESYLVKLVYNSESCDKTVTLPYGAELPTPTRDGAEFVGWFADAALTEAVKRVPAHDVTLYAAWSGESSPCDFIYRSTDGGLAIAEYVGDGGRVLIPEWVAGTRIVAICDGAFAENRDITEVIIAKNVTRVGLFAFQRCFSLKSVTLHSGVGYIDRSVFDACYALETVSYFGDKESFKSMCPYLPDGVIVNYMGGDV